MRIVTNREMKEIDTWSMHTLGIPGTVLMENAGRGCVNVLEEYFNLENLKVLIICGKGNNGGDGFVIARHLQNRGAVVKIILPGKGKELRDDTLINYKLVKKAHIKIHETISYTTIKTIFHAFHPAVIVDALFGTGFTGAPGGVYYKLIELMNNSDAFILSVDVPSGINGDNGHFEKTCVIADATATMCLPKRGNYLYPGRAFCGDIYTVDIGIPYHLIEKGYPRVTTFEDIYKIMPLRPPDGNKGTFGHVLIIAGARGFSGAAAMAAISALKIGAGLVRLAAPRGIMDALESKLLEVVKVPLPQTAEETISTESIDVLIPIMKRSDVVVIGPGITTHSETASFVSQILPKIKVPLIIDADALNCIAQNVQFFKKIKSPFILTPHPGEFSRLTHLTPQSINDNRIDLAPKFSKKFGGILVLKGAPTVIASPRAEIYINPTGNSGLASAGSGDVLVGMIAGLCAQRASLFDASRAGAFLHGLCAELAMEKNNEYSLTASDLIDYIPRSIQYIMAREFVEEKRND
jgi:hydroxyethylthiazole kinase-like uncharacterized protein yjeF